MKFLKEEKTFLMCFDRFTWEISGLSSEKLLQVQCILQVDYVNSVLADGLFKSNVNSLYSLISIAYSEKYLIFSFSFQFYYNNLSFQMNFQMSCIHIFSPCH